MMRWMKEIWKTSGDNLKRVKICPFVVNIIPWFWLALTIFLYLVTVMNIGDTLDVGAEVWCGADTKPVSWQPARFTSHLSSLRLWLRWSPRASSHLSESRLRLRNAYCLHLSFKDPSRSGPRQCSHAHILPGVIMGLLTWDLRHDVMGHGSLGQALHC